MDGRSSSLKCPDLARSRDAESVLKAMRGRNSPRKKGWSDVFSFDLDRTVGGGTRRSFEPEDSGLYPEQPPLPGLPS